MPKLNQKGVAQLLPIVILLIGLVVGVYLVGQRTNLLPKASQATPNCTNIESVTLSDGRSYGPFNNEITPEVIKVRFGEKVRIVSKIANDDNNRQSIEWNATGGELTEYLWDQTTWTAPSKTGEYEISQKLYGVDQMYCSLKFDVAQAGILEDVSCVNIKSVTREDGSFMGPITTEYPDVVKVAPNEKVKIEARVRDNNGQIIKYLDNLGKINWDAAGGTLSEQDWNKISWTAPTEDGDYQVTLMIDYKNQPACVVPFQVTSQ